MKEKPILFNGDMVRAILAGRKTQTRRVIKPQPPKNEDFIGSDFGLSRAVAEGIKMYSQNHYDALPKHDTDWDLIGSVGVARYAGFPMKYRNPFGSLGDRLWVRENFQVYGAFQCDEGWEVDYPIKPVPKVMPERCLINYAADNTMDGPHRPSIHMPRWASRITLQITDIRVERVQDISPEDSRKEGVDEYLRPITQFHQLWDLINLDRGFGWDYNPWVWVIEFQKIN